MAGGRLPALGEELVGQGRDGRPVTLLRFARIEVGRQLGAPVRVGRVDRREVEGVEVGEVVPEHLERGCEERPLLVHEAVAVAEREGVREEVNAREVAPVEHVAGRVHHLLEALEGLLDARVDEQHVVVDPLIVDVGALRGEQQVLDPVGAHPARGNTGLDVVAPGRIAVDDHRVAQRDQLGVRLGDRVAMSGESVGLIPDQALQGPFDGDADDVTVDGDLVDQVIAVVVAEPPLRHVAAHVDEFAGVLTQVGGLWHDDEIDRIWSADRVVEIEVVLVDDGDPRPPGRVGVELGLEGLSLRGIDTELTGDPQRHRFAPSSFGLFGPGQRDHEACDGERRERGNEPTHDALPSVRLSLPGLRRSPSPASAEQPGRHFQPSADDSASTPLPSRIAAEPSTSRWIGEGRHRGPATTMGPLL